MPASVTRRIAIFSTAGGGGKTTTTLNLAAALAECGQRVLVVDLDPRACLLGALGQRCSAPLLAVLHEEAAEIARRTRATELAGVSMLAVSPDFDTEEQMFRAGPDVESHLRRALETLCEGSWDFLLFDCGSNIGRLSAVALAVAHEHIAPVEASPISIGSLPATLWFADMVRTHQNPRLEPTRILVSRVGNDTPASGTIDALRGRLGDRVLQSQIPHSEALVEASARLQPVLVSEPDDPASTAYRELGRELLADVRSRSERSDSPGKRRALTIRVSDATPQSDDYLRMLDLASLPAARSSLWPSSPVPHENEHVPSTHSTAGRPRMLFLETQSPPTTTPVDGAPHFAAQQPSPKAPPANPSAAAAGREWKLSARLDRELLAELYGAAEQLAANKATVSSMVEEALRLYLPLLRCEHNGGQPFRPRGPRARSAGRKPLLETPRIRSWSRIPSDRDIAESPNQVRNQERITTATQVEEIEATPPAETQRMPQTFD